MAINEIRPINKSTYLHGKYKEDGWGAEVGAYVKECHLVSKPSTDVLLWLVHWRVVVAVVAVAVDPQMSQEEEEEEGMKMEDVHMRPSLYMMKSQSVDQGVDMMSLTHEEKGESR